MDFRKSEGRDLGLTNPYLEKTVEISNFSDISKRVIEASRLHAAGLGLRGFRVFLRTIDKDQSGLVAPEDLKYAFKAFGIAITVDEMNALLKYFDQARVGRINLNDMLHAMRSNSLSAARASIAEAAYNKLDRSGSQQVTIGDLVDNYDVTPNPELVNGRKTVDQLRQEFQQAWSSTNRAQVVSLAEFIDFYRDVSPTIIKDEFFQNMVRNSWNF